MNMTMKQFVEKVEAINMDIYEKFGIDLEADTQLYIAAAEYKTPFYENFNYPDLEQIANRCVNTEMTKREFMNHVRKAIEETEKFSSDTLLSQLREIATRVPNYIDDMDIPYMLVPFADGPLDSYEITLWARDFLRYYKNLNFYTFTMADETYERIRPVTYWVNHNIYKKFIELGGDWND